MPIPFEDIEEGFGLIREAFVEDVEPLIGQGSGGSYAVAVFVVIGHEEIARLRFGQSRRGEKSFAETLPEAWRPVASSLYKALRNGLAHGYGTQTIIIGRMRVVLGFSLTARPRPHRVDPRPIEELEADATVLFNTRKLVADLRDSFDRLEADLRRDGELRDAFRKRWIRGRTRMVRDPKEVATWRRLLRNENPD